MALSTLTPPRPSPPRTLPSKLKVRAMCNAIDQYFSTAHNQSPTKLRRFRQIEPVAKGRLGEWGTYERLQGWGGREEEFWSEEIRRKICGEEGDPESEEVVVVVEEEEDEDEEEKA